jgi:hypothetical protein
MARAAAIAGAAPLYGTCVMSTFAMALNSSPPKCAGEPMPADEKVSLPGCLFASATRSATVDTPSAPLTNRPLSVRAMLAIGLKDVSGS